VQFADEDVAGLATAMEELVSNLGHYQKAAAERAPTARDYFSPHRFGEWLMSGRNSGGNPNQMEII
jgi:hypothetical protein